jgi:hypothetical protein
MAAWKGIPGNDQAQVRREGLVYLCAEDPR